MSPGSKAPDEVNVFVEITKGSRNKFELDKETGRITLDRVLHKPFRYEWDYGLIPQTLGGDGDPLDGIIIIDQPSSPGVIIPVRPVGIMHMVDDGKEDDKIVCVPADDPDTKDVKDVSDLPKENLEKMKKWFENYKTAEGKEVSVSGFEGAGAAKRYISEAIELYRKKFGGK